MSEPILPQHQDKWSRNWRLYESLLKMGLYVVPIFADREYRFIVRLQVSSDLSETGVSGDVVTPIKWSEVGEIVSAAIGDGDNVIDFPTVF